MAYSKPTELLGDMNSHDILNARMLDECSFDTSSVPTETVEQVRAEIEARGLGGHVNGGPEDRLIAGFRVARALAVQFLGEAPGDMYRGRGSAFRANLAALDAAGH